MLLWTADITRIFEGDPWVASFKQHTKHLAPQLLRRDTAEWL